MLHQLACGLGEQDLPSVPGAHDAGGVMDIQAHIAFGGEFRLARVQAHADTYRHTCWPDVAGESPLGGHSRREGIGGTSKGDEEGIALRVDLVPVILVERRAQQVPRLHQQAGVAVAHLLEEVRGSLDIAEEQRDRSRRELTHAAPPDKGCTTHPRRTWTTGLYDDFDRLCTIIPHRSAEGGAASSSVCAACLG